MTSGLEPARISLVAAYAGSLQPHPDADSPRQGYRGYTSDAFIGQLCSMVLPHGGPHAFEGGPDGTFMPHSAAVANRRVTMLQGGYRGYTSDAFIGQLCSMVLPHGGPHAFEGGPDGTFMPHSAAVANRGMLQGQRPSSGSIPNTAAEYSRHTGMRRRLRERRRCLTSLRCPARTSWRE